MLLWQQITHQLPIFTCSITCGSLDWSYHLSHVSEPWLKHETTSWGHLIQLSSIVPPSNPDRTDCSPSSFQISCGWANFVIRLSACHHNQHFVTSPTFFKQRTLSIPEGSPTILASSTISAMCILMGQQGCFHSAMKHKMLWAIWLTVSKFWEFTVPSKNKTIHACALLTLSLFLLSRKIIFL